MNVLKEFRRAVRSFGLLRPGDGVVLGVSGGADSLALLHLFVQTRAEFGLKLHALHVHHGIRGADADADARFVEEKCAAWNVPCRVVKVDVPALAKRETMTLEEAARQARYAALVEEALRVEAAVIAVAHNADDQAETVLMHFLRGSGMAGLRGMMPSSPPPPPPGEATVAPQTGIRLIRPLLAIPRAGIEAYCQQHGLQPRVDATNADRAYFRNRLRHEIIPLLETLNPNLRETLGRTARVMADDYEMLEEIVDQAWKKVFREGPPGCVRLDRSLWNAFPLAVQRGLIRRAVARLRSDFRNLSYAHVEDAVRVAQHGVTGAQSTLPGGLMLRLDYDAVVIGSAGMELPSPDGPQLTPGVQLDIAAPCALDWPAAAWRFSLSRHAGPRKGPAWDALIAGPWAAVLDLPGGARGVSPLLLRTRRPGDRFQPQGAGGTQKLGEFMINEKIPAAWRDRIPLLVADDQIAWVCGWRVDQRFIVTAKTKEIWLAKFEVQ